MPKSHLTFRMTILAALAGIFCGAGTIIFRKLVALAHNLFFFGQFSFIYNENLHANASIWGAGILLVPAAGGIIVMWLTETFARDQRGLSVPFIMNAVLRKDGKIRISVSFAKTIAAVFSLGSGGSIGREGPVYQLGATLSSMLSDLAKLSDAQRKILIAAGVSACTSVIFHAPLTGVVFAVELLLPVISLAGLILILIATTLALVVEYTVFGLAPIFTLQTSVHDFQFFHYLLLGIITGAFSVFLIRGIYWCEDVFAAIIRNAYLRHITGMLITGALIYLSYVLFGHYYIEGIGFATVQDCLQNHISSLWLLIFIAVTKLIVTCLTLGTGAPGGVFSPALVIGAALGSLFGWLTGNDPALFALLGMAALLGSTTGALFTAVVLTVELTSQLSLLAPIIICVLGAHMTRVWLCLDNVYTLKLARQGVKLRYKYL